MRTSVLATTLTRGVPQGTRFRTEVNWTRRFFPTLRPSEGARVRLRLHADAIGPNRRRAV